MCVGEAACVCDEEYKKEGEELFFFCCCCACSSSSKPTRVAARRSLTRVNVWCPGNSTLEHCGTLSGIGFCVTDSGNEPGLGVAKCTKSLELDQLRAREDLLSYQNKRDTSLSLLCPGAKVCGKPLWRSWLGTRLATTRAFAPRYGLAVPHRHLVCLYVVQSIPP